MHNFAITISAPGTDPDEVFRTLADYERYPELTEAVLRASVEEGDEGHERCTWEVKFRRGILIWTEDGIVDPIQRRIDFSLVEGDLDSLDGHWRVAEAPGGSLIIFDCRFDMGIPTLEHLIEPVAADTLRDNVVDMCEGLFGATEVVDDKSTVHH
jgi:ribosome-associated toxin RatA of RatAB toxin-antitoxin module